jgi:putative hydrolase
VNQDLPPDDDLPPNDELPPDPFADGDPFDVSQVQPTTGTDPLLHPTPPDAPGGMGAGFGGLLGSMFGDIGRLLEQQRAQAWDQARQLGLARATATDPSGSGPDTPVDPLIRIRLEELLAIVEPRVVDATGLEVTGSGKLDVHTVSRAQWTEEFLSAHRAMFEPAMKATSGATLDASDPEQFFKNLLGVVGPSMLAMQIGTMSGQLAHRYFASPDLPLPGRMSDRIVFLPGNLSRFAEAWSLPIDSLLIRVAIDELLLHTVVRLPHIDAELRRLMGEHIAGFSLDSDSIMGQLDSLESMDPTAMQAKLQDSLLSPTSTSTPAQIAIANQLAALVSMIRAYVEVLGSKVADQILGGERRIAEALRRRRMEPDEGTMFMRALVGAEVGEEVGNARIEQATSFVTGVVERSDTQRVGRLWASMDQLPTPPEVSAPGLWLARTELA